MPGSFFKSYPSLLTMFYTQFNQFKILPKKNTIFWNVPGGKYLPQAVEVVPGKIKPVQNPSKKSLMT